MSARVAFLLIFIAGCATSPPLSDEERLWQVVARYGPECDVPADIIRARSSLRQVEIDCIVAKVESTRRGAESANNFLRSLGQGFGAAGQILQSPPSGAAPTQIDYRCVQDCTARGYQYQLCTSRCSF